MCTSSVRKVLYHKFSHGAAFYKLNGKNVNVMLKFRINRRTFASVSNKLLTDRVVGGLRLRSNKDDWGLFK